MKSRLSALLLDRRIAARALSLLVLLVAALVPATPAVAQNPTNKAECLQMMRGPLEAQCQKMFAKGGQTDQLASCFAAIDPQVSSVCGQFFGEGRDFCATCTSSCTKNFEPGNDERRQCLAMCLAQPGCQ